MNLKRNSEDIIKMLDHYNSKPFNINALIPSNDTRQLADEYRFYILSLNEYLTTKQKNVAQNEIFNMIEEWVYHNTKKKKNFNHTIVVNSARELIFISGFWASQIILSNDYKQKIMEMVNKEVFQIEKDLRKIQDTVENVQGVLEDKTFKSAIHSHKDFLLLMKEYLNFLQTNKGYPQIVYFIIELKSKEILDVTSINKKEIINFLVELFAKFDFISKKIKIKYSYDLYRNLNRVAKIEKIDSLKTTITNLLNF